MKMTLHTTTTTHPTRNSSFSLRAIQGNINQCHIRQLPRPILGNYLQPTKPNPTYLTKPDLPNKTRPTKPNLTYQKIMTIQFNLTYKI